MGSLRLFLALSVVIQHMGNPLGIRLLDAGVAVYLFFLISGFYMALVLNTKYVGPGSVPIFYLNRFVRIWPVYFVSVLISLWAGWWGILAGRMEGLASYWKAFIVFSNFTLIGLDSFLHIGLSPEGISFAPSGLSAANGMKFVINFPAWSIWSELTFYLIAPLFVRRLSTSLLLLAIGVTFCALTPWMSAHVAQPHRFDLYFPTFCVAFGLGACGYWLGRRQDLTLVEYAVAVAAAAAVLMISFHGNMGVYLLLGIAAPVLFRLTSTNRIDGFLGDLAYPLYILHIPMDLALQELLGVTTNRGAWNVLATLLVSVAAAVLVDRPIARLRHLRLKVPRKEVSEQRAGPNLRHAAAQAEMEPAVAGWHSSRQTSAERAAE